MTRLMLALLLLLRLVPSLAANASAQTTTLPAAPAAGLPQGPSWGRGGFQPKGANVLFASADGCALCHSASERSTALWSSTGEDVSPHGLWKATMMANASRDPFFRAQLASEAAKHPQLAADLESLCIRCHSPMAHHTARLAGQSHPTIAQAASHPLYGDGVSCTVCHQIQPDGLGNDATFDGQPLIKPGRTIFGPFTDLGSQPMIMHSAFTPRQGTHVQSASLCAACHTLRTEHTSGGKFPEQSPYFEWRNSVYSDEPAPNGAGRTQQSRTCQECHMPDVGAMRIARNPAGLDFNIKTREPVRGHSFVGGNAFMLDMLRENAEELGVIAPAEALLRMAKATRAQLAHRTATIAVENLRREKEADGSAVAVFDVVVTNLTGHKFPTGYPARRAWIHAELRSGRATLFESGQPDGQGRITGIEPTSELGVPHADRVTAPSQVPIYEMIAAGADGKPTILLSEMATRLKDNRLLPAGYRADGPHTDQIAPVGTDGDTNFQAGSDRVTYRVPVPADATGRLTVVARLMYQTVPPAWTDAMRALEQDEAKRFVRLYDASKLKLEQIAVTVGFSD